MNRIGGFRRGIRRVGGCYHVGAAVEARYVVAFLGELRGEDTIAAAEVENYVYTRC